MITTRQKSVENIFHNIPTLLKEEHFEDILKNDTLKIERIVSDGHISPEFGWYESSQNEWVIILQGDGILSFENGGDVLLKKGDYVNIPAHTKHKVSHTSTEQKTIWLAIFY